MHDKTISLFDNFGEHQKFEHNIKIQFDGGMISTTRLGWGNKYGSFEIREKSTGIILRQSNRFQLGEGTSGEAEWDALIVALDTFEDYISTEKIELKTVFVSIFTDSMNVIYRFKKLKAKSANPRMVERAIRCIEKLSKYGGFDYQWQSRVENVKIFGH